MICIALLLLVAATHAASVDKCVVSEWGPWSQVKASKVCSHAQARSSPMRPAKWDTGRTKMMKMMGVKNALWKERAACKNAGTCPELMAKPSSGYYPCQGGLANDIPCLNIDQLSFLNFVDLGYGSPLPGDNTPEGNDIWGWTDPQNGDEYAIMGLTGGTSFVRITDPQNPVAVGFIYSATSASTWRDMKVIGNYVYIVSEASNHGLQVFDLTHLRGLNTMTYFDPDAVYNEFGNAHNIVANEATNYVYVVGATQRVGYQVCDGGLHIVDVNNPLNPTYAGCFGDDGYVHDAQCVNYNGPDTRYTGSEVCFCYNEDSFTIVDVTDKSSMSVISKYTYTGVEYSHQGWATDDHSLVLLDDELDEYGKIDRLTKTYIWDVTDMQQPVLRTIHKSSQTSIDHNQYIVGDLTYQANYEAGLRILSIDRQSFTLNEVAYFDVLPSRTAATFAGSWSVYPYFSSGNVIISSIDYGLFVVRPNSAAIQAAIKEGKVYSEKKRSREVIYKADFAECPALEETEHSTTNISC